MTQCPALTRRRTGVLLGAASLTAALPRTARAAATIRIGLPTQTYWPTIVAKTAVQQKLFEREGISAEPTVYRGGAECFEALAADAADLILDPPAIVAAGLRRGVDSRAVAGGSTRYNGWQLMVRSDSPITSVAQLEGKKIGITSAGSASDQLALWTMQDRKVSFTKVPLGGGGLVPNLRSRNVDAAVVYSPLSFQLGINKQARVLIDYAEAIPAHVNTVWIASEGIIKANPVLLQKALNALFGAVVWMSQNRDAAIATIAEVDEIPPEIAAAEYEHTILQLSRDGAMPAAGLQYQLELARLGGMTDMASVAEITSDQFKPVPTA